MVKGPVKKVKAHKGYIIAVSKDGIYQVFTKDEWSMGEGYRYPEYDDCGSLQEAIDNIN
jgi:hypothetical protein